jgi:hypothetical protein
MIYNRILFSLLCIGSIHTIFAENPMQEKHTDLRTFLQDQPCNERNAAGNTFFYQLALDSASITSSEELFEKLTALIQKHEGCIPNLFLSHTKIENGKEVTRTAKQEAKNQFQQTGNPICALLAELLKRSEQSYLAEVLHPKGKDMLIHPNKRPRSIYDHIKGLSEN